MFFHSCAIRTVGVAHFIAAAHFCCVVYSCLWRFLQPSWVLLPFFAVLYNAVNAACTLLLHGTDLFAGTFTRLAAVLIIAFLPVWWRCSFLFCFVVLDLLYAIAFVLFLRYFSYCGPSHIPRGWAASDKHPSRRTRTRCMADSAAALLLAAVPRSSPAGTPLPLHSPLVAAYNGRILSAAYNFSITRTWPRRAFAHRLRVFAVVRSLPLPPLPRSQRSGFFVFSAHSSRLFVPSALAALKNRNGLRFYRAPFGRLPVCLRDAAR
jgi:hypothetical protein